MELLAATLSAVIPALSLAFPLAAAAIVGPACPADGPGIDPATRAGYGMPLPRRPGRDRPRESTCPSPEPATVATSCGAVRSLPRAHAPGASDGSGGTAGDLTRIALPHHEVPAEMIEHIGPGREWYLDRLTGVVTGSRVPGMEVWGEQYMSLAPEYVALGS